MSGFGGFKEVQYFHRYFQLVAVRHHFTVTSNSERNMYHCFSLITHEQYDFCIFILGCVDILVIEREADRKRVYIYEQTSTICNNRKVYQNVHVKWSLYYNEYYWRFTDWNYYRCSSNHWSPLYAFGNYQYPEDIPDDNWSGDWAGDISISCYSEYQLYCDLIYAWRQKLIL